LILKRALYGDLKNNPSLSGGEMSNRDITSVSLLKGLRSRKSCPIKLPRMPKYLSHSKIHEFNKSLEKPPKLDSLSPKFLTPISKLVKV
jgi:hypothetical protein